MTEPEDPEVAAMRERAERVMARRAKERAAPRTDAEAAPEPKKKGGRRWYHWVIDGALLLFAAYFIKQRFFTKEPQAPATAPVAATSTSAPSAAASVIKTKSSAEVRLGPGQMYAVEETVPPGTVVEVVEVSKAGFVKVKVPSGKTGWVPTDSIK